ncbi:hypothetical protein BC936DRAFT_145139 [Jimgerdemannia flammicorona]|uniref:Uncharacterized protein n=1 Tax=Jimgerdemannia flammicorona TaxID=994334 RepID=A0A433DAU4_9FUNG|nr:hypothetical protein BC936DRAFT_145139 [Jimgerdemannia flammicorona]
MDNNPFRYAASAQQSSSAWNPTGINPPASQQQQYSFQQQQQPANSNPYNLTGGTSVQTQQLQPQPTGNQLYGGLGGLGGNGYSGYSGYNSSVASPTGLGLGSSSLLQPQQTRTPSMYGQASLLNTQTPQLNTQTPLLTSQLNTQTLAQQNYPQPTGGYSQTQQLSQLPYGQTQQQQDYLIDLGQGQPQGNPYMTSTSTSSPYGQQSQQQQQQLLRNTTGFPLTSPTSASLYGGITQQQQAQAGLMNPLLLQGQYGNPYTLPAQNMGYVPNPNQNYLIHQQQPPQQQQRQPLQPPQQQPQRPAPPKPDDKVRVAHCPVCNATIEGDETALNYHVNEHFEYGASTTMARPTAATASPRREATLPLEAPVNDADYARRLYQEESNRQLNQRHFR